MTKILDGKSVAIKLESELKQKISSANRSFSLGILQVGESPSSVAYINHKIKMAKRLGVQVNHIKIPQNASQQELIDHINSCNQDKSIDGFILQLPLPDHINREAAINKIDPLKDVDGITIFNQGRLLAKEAYVLPATTRGILSLLNYYNIQLSGKHVVCIGRSNLVGLPSAISALHEDATISIVHSKSNRVPEISRLADVVIVATGQPSSITREHLNAEAVVIDVGISRIEGKLVGDVDHESVYGHVAALSPVPGGVGPLTVISLFQNLYDMVIGQA